ncbi:uncharacterized protein [Haliotis cracherodii]|uniref:uncharacterized protein n=1 Tax=Haliotis cracherodii TaxID=6455 RepID=UPI0039E9488B
MSDFCMSVHRLLHNGVFVMFTAALVTARTEITHHEVSDGVSKYIFQNGTRRNCMPILPTDNCPEDHQIEPCFHDKDKDRCVPCRKGEEQLDRTDSDFRSACYVFHCPEGTIPAKQDPASGCNWPCRCESERMVMNEHCSCQDVKVQCGKNTYLKDGVCLPCPTGTYKPGHGTGPCISQMSSFTQSPRHNLTTTSSSPASQIKTTLGAKGNLTRIVTGTNMTDGGIEAEEKPPKNGSSNNQIILAICISTLVLIVLVLLVAAGIYMYRLRKKKLSCHSTAQPSDSNESLVQYQATGNRADAHIDGPPPYSLQDPTSPIWVNMEDEEGQGMAQPFTGDFSTDQASGVNKASSVSPVRPDPEGVATPPAVVSVPRQDSHETVRKEYGTSPLPETTDITDVSFPTLQSAEQADPVASEHSKDADHTSMKKRYSSNMKEVSSENEKAENVESLPLLESAPSLKLDSFKS